MSMKSIGKISVIIALSLIGNAYSDRALAQISVRGDPSIRTSDRLNVDVTTGLPHWVVSDVSIGPEGLGFQHSISSYKASFLSPKDDYKGSVISNQPGSACQYAWAGTAYLVSFRGIGECFYEQQGFFRSYDGKGSYLEVIPGGYIYTLFDGTKAYYSTAEGEAGFGLKKIVEPNGTTTRVFYEYSGQYYRIRSVEKNTGYRLYYNYSSDVVGSTGWSVFSGVSGYNAGYLSCVSGTYCNVSQEWPRSSYNIEENAAGTTVSIIDQGGQATKFSTDSSYQYNNLGRFNKVTLSTSDVPDIEYKYCPYDNSCLIMQYANNTIVSTHINDLVVSAKKNGLTWTYGLVSAGPENLERNSSGPNGYIVKLLTKTNGNLISMSSPEGAYTFVDGPGGQIASAPNSDGAVSSFVRDDRGNILQVRKGGYLERTAIYSSTCVNRVTCNKPLSVSDANGNQTTYEYDPIHGGVLRAIGPTVGGVTREVRYSYEERHESYLDGTGALVQDPDPIWVLEQESTCRTGASTGAGCALAGDEVRTVYERGPANSVGSLLVMGVVHDATGVAARTCYAYDRFGNKISETAPAAQLASCL